MDARPWLEELRQRCGCSRWITGGADPAAETQQLQEALPLLMMLVTRLREESSAEALGEVKHSWHKALRRRGWHALPPLHAGREGDEDGTAEDPAERRSQPASASAAAMDPAHCARQVAAFLSLFGRSLTVDRSELQCIPGLAETVDALVPRARSLLTGPLRPPAAYERAYLEIVTGWNRVVRTDALRLPEE